MLVAVTARCDAGLGKGDTALPSCVIVHGYMASAAARCEARWILLWAPDVVYVWLHF